MLSHILPRYLDSTYYTLPFAHFQYFNAYCTFPRIICLCSCTIRTNCIYPNNCLSLAICPTSPEGTPHLHSAKIVNCLIRNCNCCTDCYLSTHSDSTDYARALKKTTGPQQQSRCLYFSLSNLQSSSTALHQQEYDYPP